MSLLENQVGGEKRLAGIPILGNPSLATPNLQFDSVNNRFIWVATVAASLSEIEFIRDQVKLGNWLEVSGNIDAAGNTIVFTPASGKTLFMYEAKITSRVNMAQPASQAIDEVIGQFRVATIVKDTAAVGGQIVGEGANNKVGGFGGTTPGIFHVKGLSLVGDGGTTIDIQNSDDDGFAFATMSGFIEDT